jgi:hypothetical protein
MSAGISLATAAAAVGLANGAVSLGNQLFGDTPSAPTGHGGSGGGGGSGSGNGGYFQSDISPQVTQGSSNPINLGTGINVSSQLSNTAQGPLSYVAQGGLIEGYAKGGPLSLEHQVSQGYSFSPIDLYHHSGPRFQQLSSSMPDIKAETYAEGGEIEHNPEFYSEGGLQHRYVQGDGDGTSDSVPAMLANGEFVIPADVVSALGNGSSDSGSKVLDELLQTVREHKQAHDPKDLPPDSKGALEYLKVATHRAGGIA